MIKAIFLKKIKHTLQMQQTVDLPKVLTTVNLLAQEKISGRVLQRLLLTKQGTYTAQVQNTSVV